MDDIITRHSAIMDKYDPTQARLARRGRMGHLVRHRAGHQSRLPVPAEHAARRARGGAQHQHLRQARRPREDGQHRPDDQRAAGHDPDQGREDGPDAHLSRLRDVQVVPGRAPPSPVEIQSAWYNKDASTHARGERLRGPRQGRPSARRPGERESRPRR